MAARPLRADAARNRQLLLDAACGAFRTGGVTASLDEVARAAGVGPGTLYRHFPTRDDLVLAVIDDGLAGLQQLGTELLDSTDPLAALQHWLTAWVQQGSVFEGLARTLVSPPTAGSDTCRAARAAGAALVARAAEHGLVQPDTVIQDVLDMAAAIAWVGEQPGRDPNQQDRLLSLVINGLRVPS